jgi:hypothetical protein
VTATTLTLHRAARRLTDRLLALEARLDAEPGAWSEYCATSSALAAISPQLAPGRAGEMLTTAEMAAKLGVSSKTLLKRRRAGTIRAALDFGKRDGKPGRALIRWRGDERFDPGQVAAR